MMRNYTLTVLALLAMGSSHAQDQRLPVTHGIRVRGGSAIQRPVGLQLHDVRSKHLAKHVFLDVAYQRSIGPRYGVGFGTTLSWSSYGVAIEGTVADASGTRYLSDTKWSPIHWYPVQTYFQEGASLRTDPIQFYLEGTRVLGSAEGMSWFELKTMVGYMLPVNIALTVDTDVPNDQAPLQEAIRASTEFGYQGHAMVGLGVERIIKLPSGGRIGGGVEWRSSLDGHFSNELRIWPGRSTAVELRKETVFMWFGVRVGYTWGWSSGRAEDTR